VLAFVVWASLLGPSAFGTLRSYAASCWGDMPPGGYVAGLAEAGRVSLVLIAGWLFVVGLAAAALARKRIRSEWGPAAGVSRGLIARRDTVGGGIALAGLVLGAAMSLSLLGPGLFQLSEASLDYILTRGLPGLERALLALGICLIATGCIERIWRRWWLTDALRMSRREALDEHRQAEGDPRWKTRQMHLARSAVARSSGAGVGLLVMGDFGETLVLGPRGGEGWNHPPRILARGFGREAHRIRAAARNSKTPSVRDPWLVRKLSHTPAGQSVSEVMWPRIARWLKGVLPPGGGP